MKNECHHSWKTLAWGLKFQLGEKNNHPKLVRKFDLSQVVVDHRRFTSRCATGKPTKKLLEKGILKEYENRDN